MFPFFGSGRDDREWCPYCLKERGMLQPVGTVRVPNPNYDPDAKPEKQGLFTIAPPAEKRDETILKKDADGNTVHACSACKTEVPAHLRLDHFHLTLMCLMGLGQEKLKECGVAIIELLDEAKRQQEAKKASGGVKLRDQIYGMMGMRPPLYVDESPDEPEAAAAASPTEDE